jgi:hypothetical protein
MSTYHVYDEALAQYARHPMTSSGQHLTAEEIERWMEEQDRLCDQAEAVIHAIGADVLLETFKRLGILRQARFHEEF